ncbi:UDP-N-acetylmuramyl pentapeptide phosphotransferase [Microbacterium sp.]|uniref:UDP-N-acetylmuramyl pentapeptide phosphotransferase n=1 Tax=Microbacterium sp. TaxID=51671 RepID=UPI0039E6D68C
MSGASDKPSTGQIPVVHDPLLHDPASRPDVLLRRRRPVDHRVNAWWLIGAFITVSVAVLALMNLFPGG